MTAEKTKPDEDEIGDEQLEDVVGAGDVFANSRGININSSGGTTIGFPDVSGVSGKDGGPAVPIPYPADGDDGSSSGNPPGSPSGD